ncbi:MAG: helix-turn-helix transcriptional regulator [Bacteroidia bacterium]|nr:helix-turn-helix transcriptional regulator [Bacteroidia bacterium]
MANADEKTGVRLQQFLSAENITQAQFADSLGITRASISHILAGRNKPSFDFLSGVLRRYPNLSIDWLIAGKGRMYRTPAAELFAAEQSGSLTSDSPLEDDYSRSDSSRPRDSEPSGGLTANPAPINAREADNPGLKGDLSGNTASTTGTAASANRAQNPAAQRRISRVVLFYDDGTYMEFE